jgi:hypothetical protein
LVDQLLKFGKAQALKLDGWPGFRH